MTTNRVTPLLYGFAVASLILVLMCKLMHWPNVFILFLLCMALQYVFAVAAILDLRNSNTHSFNEYERSRWPVLIMLLPIPFGFFYLRKKLSQKW